MTTLTISTLKYQEYRHERTEMDFYYEMYLMCYSHSYAKLYHTAAKRLPTEIGMMKAFSHMVIVIFPSLEGGFKGRNLGPN